MESDGFPDLIPGLRDDLALLCLARLPRRLHPLASCVSRSWHHVFHSRSLLADLRRRLGTQETWLFLCLRGDTRDTHAICSFDYSWWLLDPDSDSPRAQEQLPSPPFPHLTFVDFNAAMGEGEAFLIANVSAPLFPNTGISTPIEEIHRLDVCGKCWLSPSPPNMIRRRRSFASAILDGHVYVAGGMMWKYPRDDGVWMDDHGYLAHFSSDSDQKMPPLKSVERLNCKSMSSWESVPDMHVARGGAVAVVMDGRLCVIGGSDEAGHPIYSGEMWDAGSQTWVLVPELWPYHAFKTTSCFENGCHIVVLLGTLFAISHDHAAGKAELMKYESAIKVWTSLGCIPHGTTDGNGANCVNDGIDYALFGVGKELWVMVHGDRRHDAFMMACSPFSAESGGLSWRRLPYSFHHFKLYLGLSVTF